MSKLLPEWNESSVVAFAPDQASVRAGQKLSPSHKWSGLGHDDTTIWGLLQGSGKNPYRVKIDLIRMRQEQTGFHCTCPSRKQPCKHVLGLLFIVVNSAGAIRPSSTKPDYVQEWFKKVEAQKKKREAKKEKNPENAKKTAKSRLATIMTGLNELEPWLIHLVRHGLVDAQIKDRAMWEQKAARMIDSKAPTISNRLLEMVNFPDSGEGWEERLLIELGNLYFLVHSFRQFNNVSLSKQADLRTAVGWYHRREDIEDGDGESVQDQWFVVGHTKADTNKKLKMQQIWLYGKKSGRSALILEFAFGDTRFETQLGVGGSFDGIVVYFPSNTPLRAFINKRKDQVPPIEPPHFQGDSIEKSVAKYGQVVASNPWIVQYPLILDDVISIKQSNNWIVQDASGAYLPISGHFSKNWELIAMCGHQPVQVIGEWDGREFLPLTAIVDRRIVDLSKEDK